MFNARSIANKISELHELLYSSSYDIYFVTETWLHKGICTDLLDPNGQYIVLRNDHTISRGGGVCAFIRNALRVVPKTFSDEFCDIEVTGFDVIASNTRARFFVVYRPPKQDVDAVKYMKKLVKCLSNYESKKYTNIILGDFNLPKIDWTNYTGDGHEVNDIFLTFIIESGQWLLLACYPSDL